MAVIGEHEIQLNGIRYPITGQVSPILSAKFAEKMVVGEFTKASNPEVDSWVIADNRGGILAEEMDETRQANRAWWSTCNLGFLGHITLPPLATSVTVPFTPDLALINGTMEAGTEAAEAEDENYGTGTGLGFAQGVDWAAQTFTPKVDITLTKVSLKLKREGTPGTITVSIRATSSNYPVTPDLTSGTTDGDTLDTNWETREIDLTDYALTPGTLYAIVVRAADASGVNYLRWALNSSGTYTIGEGVTSGDSGANWGGTGGGNDYVFSVYGKRTTVDNWTGGARSTEQEDAGTYSLWLNDDDSYQVIVADDTYKGQYFKITIKAYCGAASTARISITDGVSAVTYSSYHSGTPGWETLTVRHICNSAATKLWVQCHADTAADAFFDTATIVDPNSVFKISANFNSKLYGTIGDLIVKLNTAGTAFTALQYFTADITDLVSDGSYLYIYLGDSTKYYYMDTSDAFTENTDAVDANLGIFWDNKLFKVSATGILYYTTTSPANDATDWTTGDTLPLTSGYLKSLFLYRDASGNYVIYGGTRTGLWAYDFTNAKWIETEVALPDHPTCGMGTVHWRDASYTSAGLDVLRYQTGGAGTSIASVGLDRDDGLPNLRGGEIIKHIKGYNEFFALVDSTYEGTTSRSTVMAYDGKGWQCWWKAGSNNLHMYGGIVSSVVRYALWYGVGNSIYYIALQRNLRNPKKVSTFAFDTEGIHITPWFDANWVGQKLALQFKIFCKDTTADQDVLVEYRIDHIETDLTTGWNNLGTIVASGNEVETTYTFGSSLGTNFKAIQFRFTLGRITTGTTPEYYSPDIQYAVLEYQKIIKPTWGWAFTIDCTGNYAGRTPNQMLDAVVTAAELEVLTPFLYKDTTYYVRVKSVEGERLSGDGQKGTYNVLVLKPI